MKIENKIRKRIKTITMMTGKYPKEIEVSEEEYNELEKYARDVTTYLTRGIEKFEGVRLKVK